MLVACCLLDLRGEGCSNIYGIIVRCPPPPHPRPAHRGLVGTKDPPPPYFGVEKFKKIGTRVIGDGGGSL